MIYGYSVSFSHGTTFFEENRVGGKGAALDVHVCSNASWTGVTTFKGDTANRAGAIFVWKLDVSWTGNTTFVDTVANLGGGAVYATVNTQNNCQGTTIFRNNAAVIGNGGALGIYGYDSDEESYVHISGETTFANDVALMHGGGILSNVNDVGQHVEGVTFRSNSAGIGGAVATFGTGTATNVRQSPQRSCDEEL